MATGRTGRRSGIAALLMLLTLLWGGALPHAQEAAQPAISAPVTGGARGEPFGTAAGDLPAGYVEEERLLSGTARSYSKVGSWEIDGRWEAQPAREAAYTVRMLVRRPADPADFNGVAVVEWLNVSPMFETAADYAHLEAELVRGGYVWVGVGAQSAGVNAPRTGLKAWDPDRYRPLAHPGDAFSYDIFSQAIRALRRTPEAAPAGGPDVAPVVHPLDGFAIRHVIAAGRSQSAMRLVTYVNAVHPRTGLPDGYLIHSRGGTPAGLTADRLTGAADPMPAGAHVRTDAGAPVLDVQAEGDLVVLRSHLARQAPHARLRRWEIAGAAHAEIPRWVVSDASPPDSGPGCATPVNAAPHGSKRPPPRWTGGATPCRKTGTRAASGTSVSCSAAPSRSAGRPSRRSIRTTTRSSAGSTAPSTGWCGKGTCWKPRRSRRGGPRWSRRSAADRPLTADRFNWI